MRDRNVYRLSIANYGIMIGVRSYPLEGVEVYELKVLPDERGFFAEALRNDWAELLDGEWFVQANLSYSYLGIVRAWHKHERRQIGHFLARISHMFKTFKVGCGKVLL